VIHFATIRITVCHCSLPNVEGARVRLRLRKKRRRKRVPELPSQWLKANCQATAPQHFILKFPKSEKETRPTLRPHIIAKVCLWRNVMWNLHAGHSRVMSSGKAGCGFEGGGKREASREATRPQHVTLKEAATNLKAFC
jgi:hypothetical protein